MQEDIKKEKVRVLLVSIVLAVMIMTTFSMVYRPDYSLDNVKCSTYVKNVNEPTYQIQG